MRRISSAALIGLLVAVQGCTINVPTGLFSNLGITATPKPQSTDNGNGCAAKFAALDKNQDQFLTEDEFNGSPNAVAPSPKATKFAVLHDAPEPDKSHQTFHQLDADGDERLSLAEFSATCGVTVKPTPKPFASSDVIIAKGAFFGFASCEQALLKFDTDRDERLSPGEYAVWQMGLGSQPAPLITKPPVAKRPASPVPQTSTAGLLSMPTPPDRMVEPMPRPPEMDRGLPPFEKLDQNRDQYIDRAELCALGEMIAPPPPLPPQNDCQNTFLRADRNGNGAITPDEYVMADFAPPPPPGVGKPMVMPSEGDMAIRFKQLDANADGQLDPGEFCADWGPIAVVTSEPAPMWDDCQGVVKSYDRDLNAQVTWEEYYTGFLMPISARYDGQKDEVYARFKGLDRNADGVLTPEEFCPVGASPTPVPTKPDDTTPSPIPVDDRKE